MYMVTTSFMKILKFFENFEIFEILKKKSEFLDSDDNARGSRITITVVCSLSLFYFHFSYL